MMRALILIAVLSVPGFGQTVVIDRAEAVQEDDVIVNFFFSAHIIQAESDTSTDACEEVSVIPEIEIECVIDRWDQYVGADLTELILDGTLTESDATAMWASSYLSKYNEEQAAIVVTTADDIDIATDIDTETAGFLKLDAAIAELDLLADSVPPGPVEVTIVDPVTGEETTMMEPQPDPLLVEREAALIERERLRAMKIALGR